MMQHTNTPKSITRKELSSMYNVSYNTVRRRLELLIEKGIIKPHQKVFLGTQVKTIINHFENGL